MTIDLCIPPEDEMIKGVASYIQTDITKRDDVRKALEGVDVVFHTAALLPFSIKNTHHAMKRVNVEGTRHVIEACAANGVKRLIYTSSCSVIMGKSCSFSGTGVAEELVPLPEDPLNSYVETKGEAEMLVRRANGVKGLRTCAIRLGGLLGGKKNPTMPEFAATQVRMLGVGNYSLAWTTLKAATKVHLIAEKHLREKAISSRENTFNVVLANIIYKDVVSFCSQQNGGKDPLVVPMWIGRLLATFNDAVFRLSGYIPFGECVNLNVLDHFRPCVCSPKHTEQELGWAEHRPWQEIVKEVIISEYNNEL